MHCPRTMSDLLMLPASRRRSPEVWVCFVRSDPARSTSVRRAVWMHVGSCRSVSSQHQPVRVKTYIPLAAVNTQSLDRDEGMASAALTVR